MKKTFGLSLIILSALVLSACTQTVSQQAQPESTPTIEVTTETTNPDSKLQANYEFTAEEDGVVALDLLSANATVETKDYGDAGQFVTSINGLEGNNEYYWAFYLNGEYAEKGASQTILQKGDTIKFVYEAVTLSN